MKIKFIPAKDYPKEEGQYLLKDRSAIQLIHVVKQEPDSGAPFDISRNPESYFAIARLEFGWKNVKTLRVEQFSEKIEFEEEFG